jgi:putative ABC transport system permease protein
MKTILGIPMNAMLIAMLVLLGGCLFFLAWTRWRYPVIFRVGVRNIARRKAQSVLIVVGLMLSTMIIATSLGTGDTVNYSISVETYELLGHLDEIVVYSQDIEGNANNAMSTKIDEGTLALVEETFRNDENVDGIMPFLLEPVPVVNFASGQGEPEVLFGGYDPARADDFGGLWDVDGDAIDLAALAEDEVVLSERAAEDLDAAVDDRLTTFFDNQPITLAVAAIAPDSAMTASLNLNAGGMVMPLDRLQQLTGQEGKLSLIGISNAGGVHDSLDATEAVVAKLEEALEGRQLGYQAVKQDLVDEANQNGEMFTDIFLLMGLFSIASGILLIILIFTMLAAERRSEMGISRAIGTRGKQLILSFASEGGTYAFFAGLVGAALGILATFALAGGLGFLFGDEFTIQAHVEPRSLVIAYSLGVVLTFAVVVIASWRISRLNIVAAVRDIPVEYTARRKRWVILGAPVVLILGGLLTLGGLQSEQAFPFYLGMSMLPFAVAMVLRYFGAGGRIIYTPLSIYLLLFWLIPESVEERLFGEMNAGMEMFFLSGIALVVASTLLIVQNSSLLLGAITRLGGLFRSWLPAVRTAVSYPASTKGRTGMMIAMFSLIVFSLVVMATITHNFSELMLGDDANAGWDVRADMHGTNPIDDFEAALQAEGVDTSGFTESAIVTIPHVASQARLSEGEWKSALIRGMDDDFITLGEFGFQQRAEGYETDEAVIQALLTEPNVAVIDASSVPGEAEMGVDPDMFRLEGVKSGDKVFNPVTIQIDDPDGETPATLKIIGVIDAKYGSLYGIFTNQRTADAIYPSMQLRSYYFALEDPELADATAKEIEAALLTNGVQATSIHDELEDAQAQATGFLYIFEGFMGLGLVIGVIAVGVIAFRNVIERRQQIGVLRAIGYRRQMVARAFMVETAYVVGIAVLAGTILGLGLAYNLFASDSFPAGQGGSFLVPWTVIAVILVGTIAASLLMTWLPARRAAGIAPAEALRYE